MSSIFRFPETVPGGLSDTEAPLIPEVRIDCRPDISPDGIWLFQAVRTALRSEDPDGTSRKGNRSSSIAVYGQAAEPSPLQATP